MADTKIATYRGEKASGSYKVTGTIELWLADGAAESAPFTKVWNVYIRAATADLLRNKSTSGWVSIGGTRISLTFSSTPLHDSVNNDYYIFASFPEGREIQLADVSPGDTFFASISATIAGTSLSCYDFLPYPVQVHITPPTAVYTSALNRFSCTPFRIPSGSLTMTAYGVITPSYRSSQLYTSASTALAKESAGSLISYFYWYPSHLNVGDSDFQDGAGEYYLSLSAWRKTTNFGNVTLINFDRLEGQILYQETPPAEAYPSLTLSATETEGAGLLARYGKYIKGKSKVQFKASYSLKYGAYSSAFEMIVNGVWGSATTRTISPTADGTVEATITDDHAASTTVTRNYYVYDYWDPSMPTMAIHRCRQDGTKDDSGGYVLIEWAINVAPLGGQNSKVLTITHPEGTTTPTLSTYDASGSLIVAADTETSYDITFSLSDDFTSIERTVRLSTAGVTIDVYRGGKGLAIGKVAEYDKTLEISSELTTILNTTDAKKIDLIDALKKLATKTGVDIYVAEQSANS